MDIKEKINRLFTVCVLLMAGTFAYSFIAAGSNEVKHESILVCNGVVILKTTSDTHYRANHTGQFVFGNATYTPKSGEVCLIETDKKWRT